MRPNFKAVLNLAAVLSLGSTSGLAANISLSPLDDDPAHALVAVEGDFEAGDHIKFRTQVGPLTKAIVVLSSDGGNLQAGIEIGKTIRLRLFATAVLDGLRCASSCAFAWLGGSPRFMEQGAQIGFHAAYIENGGRPLESGVGNALLGSYLTQIGLSERAVVYITRAAPTGMTWLTLPDAKQIGIEVLPFEQQTSATKTLKKRVTSYETSNQEIGNRAQLFVKEFSSRYSRSNSVERLGPAYADEVNYLFETNLKGYRHVLVNKLMSREELLAFHRLQFQRWPEHSYRIHDKSMKVVCGERRPDLAQPVECIVTGTLEFSLRSLARNAAASGLQSFTAVLRASGDTFLIKESRYQLRQIECFPPPGLFSTCP